MTKGSIALLIISTLCLELISVCLCESNALTKPEDYKELKQETSVLENLQDESKQSSRKDSRQMNVVVEEERLMRARGVYGGASDMRRSNSKNDANSLRIKSTPCLILFFWKVACGFSLSVIFLQVFN